MTGLVPHETGVAARAAACAYAGLDADGLSRLVRRYRKKVRPVEFILAWRDGMPTREIAARFELRTPKYVTDLRRAMGLPARSKAGGGPGASHEASP